MSQYTDRTKAVLYSFISLRAFLLSILIIPVLFTSPVIASVPDKDKIVLQLRWLHQFQFAGYYAALHKGFYRDKGLNVEIIAGAPNRQPVDEVLAGRAHYGEANSELLHSYLNGKPVVALAAIVQHSPSILLSRFDSDIRSPQDLVGKKVMMVGGTADIDFLSMLVQEGINPESLDIVPSSYNIDDLIDGKVDAFNAYVTNEPYTLIEKEIKTYNLEPLNYGIDFYSDILFTTKKEINENPERVKAFREASIQGWEYALKHKQEIIDLILKEYGPVKSRKHLEYEANTIDGLILPNLVPIGNINPGRFKKMADSLVQFGFAEADYSLDDFIFDPNPKIELSTYYQTISIFIVIFFIILIYSVTVLNFNRRLKKEVTRARDAENKLKDSELHHRRIIENLQDIYYRTDNNGLIVDLSPSAEITFGYQKEKMIGQQIENYYAPGYSREGFLIELKNTGGKLQNYELKGLNNSGEERWISVNSQFVYKDNEIIGVEGTIRDISEKKEFEQQIIQVANSDSLTNLSNRRALLDNLEHTISFNSRRSQFGGLLFIDLDKFKPVNDQYGHKVGDELLIKVADRLRAELRGEDSVYRIGGDEFTVLIPELNSSVSESVNMCEQIAKKVYDGLTKSFIVNGIEINISASIGGVLLPEEDISTDELMHKADIAMYQAKKDKSEFFIMSK